jgi:hypothetical protein
MADAEKKTKVAPEAVSAAAVILADRFDIGIELAEVITEEVLQAAFCAIRRASAQTQ